MTPPTPANGFWDDYHRVSAHLPDRMGTVVVGALLPYDPDQGERVQDDAGDIWEVVADSVRSAPE